VNIRRWLLECFKEAVRGLGREVLRSIDNEYTIPPLEGLQVSGAPYFPDMVNAYLRLAIETDHLYIGML
jgi:hypothetical protein